jgi:adenylosuccinate synthase
MIDQQYANSKEHCTWSDVTPYNAREFCKIWSIDDITTIGVTRCYSTRHGEGQFNDNFNLELEDDGNKENQWQGKLRYGLLNLHRLQYAIEACVDNGGLDFMAVNHLDEYEKVGQIDGGGHGTDLHISELLETLGTLAPIGITAYGPTSADREMTPALRQRILKDSLLESVSESTN